MGSRDPDLRAVLLTGWCRIKSLHRSPFDRTAFSAMSSVMEGAADVNSPILELVDVLRQAASEALRTNDLDTLSSVRHTLKDAVRRLQRDTG